MNEETGIEITGIDEACAALDRLSSRVAKDYLSKALVAGAVPIFQAIDARTPVGTGNLRTKLFTDVAVKADGSGGMAKVGFNKDAAHIARFVEYGHRMIGHQPTKKEEGPVSAHPFMRPAAAAAKEAAVEAFRDSILQSIAEDKGH